jgi:hypothetical protein
MKNKSFFLLALTLCGVNFVKGDSKPIVREESNSGKKPNQEPDKKQKNDPKERKNELHGKKNARL